jgi:hypothetical protein
MNARIYFMTTLAGTYVGGASSAGTKEEGTTHDACNWRIS